MRGERAWWRVLVVCLPMLAVLSAGTAAASAGAGSASVTITTGTASVGTASAGSAFDARASGGATSDAPAPDDGPVGEGRPPSGVLAAPTGVRLAGASHAGSRLDQRPSSGTLLVLLLGILATLLGRRSPARPAPPHRPVPALATRAAVSSARTRAPPRRKA